MVSWGGRIVSSPGLRRNTHGKNVNIFKVWKIGGRAGLETVRNTAGCRGEGGAVNCHWMFIGVQAIGGAAVMREMANPHVMAGLLAPRAETLWMPGPSPRRRGFGPAGGSSPVTTGRGGCAPTSACGYESRPSPGRWPGTPVTPTPSRPPARTNSRRRGWCGSRRAWSGPARSCGGCA